MRICVNYAVAVLINLKTYRTKSHTQHIRIRLRMHLSLRISTYEDAYAYQYAIMFSRTAT
jgi:hypothetical protein